MEGDGRDAATSQGSQEPPDAERGKAGTSPRVFGDRMALPAFKFGLLAPELAESKFLLH